MTLATLVRHALMHTRNTGRPVEDWELRSEAGVLLVDRAKTVSDHVNASSGSLYLTLRLGVGGATPLRARGGGATKDP